MRNNCLLVAALLLITVACLWPVGRLGFIGYDDLDYVSQNPVVQSGINPDSVAWAFGGAHAGNWHPVTWLSHMLDCELFGLDPHEEHWVNLGFHAANVLLVFLWLTQLTGARWRSFFVAALFATHPLHVQSVAWISERKDVLSGFFFLATLIGYTHYCRNRNAKNYIWVLIWLGLGLMAKPMLVTTPLVLLLIDFWPLARNHAGSSSPLSPGFDSTVWKALVMEKIPMFLLCAGAGLVTLWAQHSGGAMDSLQQFSLPSRCIHAPMAYCLYLGKMIWPVNLAILYPLSSDPPHLTAILGSLVLLVLLFTAGLLGRRTRPYLLVGWSWFFIMLLPVIGLIQVGLQTMADRYTYLPSIGLFIAIVWSAAEMAKPTILSGAAVAALGTACVLACGIDTRYQLRFWQNNVTLFLHVVDVSPKDNALGYFYLGISYAEIGRLDPAEICLREALKVYPNFALAKSRMGNVLLAEKKYPQAEPYLASEAAARPESVRAHATLGMALEGQGKFAAAQSEYEAAQQLAPGNPAINQLLTANYSKAAAERTLLQLGGQLQNEPDAPTLAAAASANATLGHYAEAIQQYRAALAQKPDSADNLNNLAWLLATCPADTVRNGVQAVEFAQQACALTQYKNTLFIGTLGAACAESGRFDDAIAIAQKACDNASANGESDLLESNRRLLILYQNHQAYHEAPEAR